jgi:hypothetical protein
LIIGKKIYFAGPFDKNGKHGIPESHAGRNERQHESKPAKTGAKWFSALDLKGECWQVDVHPDDKEQTAISTGQGLWQFTVMPFGLCNAPATFDKLMETVLRGFTYDSCLVYVDDLTVIGRTFQERLLNLRKVFQRFREARLKLIPEKCQHMQKEVRNLGHIVSPERKTTDPEELKAVRECSSPKNKHEIRSFLDLCTY